MAGDRAGVVDGVVEDEVVEVVGVPEGEELEAGVLGEAAEELGGTAEDVRRQAAVDSEEHYF